MPKNNTSNPPKELQKELSGLKEKFWKTPFRLWLLLNIVAAYYFILSWIEDVDLMPSWCNSWCAISFILAALLAVRIHIESRALKKYLPVLERQRFDEAISYGREYYSIKRKGFSGLDGQAYTIDDDDAIAKDIAIFAEPELKP